VTQAALASLCVIIVTGALVRLTGSGLGCEDWPRCNEQKLIDVSTHHTRIEQLNRLFTGVVSASVVVAVLGAYRRRAIEPRLVRWAWSLVIGVLAQVVLGGVVVLTGLHPLANMGHFLLSMVLVTCGWVLVQLARRSESDHYVPGPVVRSIRDVGLSRLRWAMSLCAIAAIVTGTVVTASGPHAGDENAPRFNFALSSVARIHGLVVIATVTLIVALLYASSRRSSDRDVRHLRESVTVVGWLAVAQAGVGYWQFFTGVPAGLVLVHIAGATVLWLSVCNVVVSPGSKVRPAG
jgi:cytochrome c oxidase assembly protein subunit 15